MDYHQVNIPVPNGPPIKGLDIPIEQSNEKFNEYVLDDGTILRAKLVVSGIIRTEGQWDQEGHPQYTILSHNVVRVVQSHPSLRDPNQRRI